jgi:hypothetical protein
VKRAIAVLLVIPLQLTTTIAQTDASPYNSRYWIPGYLTGTGRICRNKSYAEVAFRSIDIPVLQSFYSANSPVANEWIKEEALAFRDQATACGVKFACSFASSVRAEVQRKMKNEIGSLLSG